MKNLTNSIKLLSFVLVSCTIFSCGLLFKDTEKHIEFQDSGKLSADSLQQVYKAYLQKHPDKPEAYFLLARISDGQEAENLFKQGLQKSSNNFYLNYGYGNYFYKKGKYEAALPWLNKACFADTANYKPYYLKGKSYHGLKDYGKALEFLRESLRYVPSDDPMYNAISNEIDKVRTDLKVKIEEEKKQRELREKNNYKKFKASHKLLTPVGSWHGTSKQSGDLELTVKNGGDYTLRYTESRMIVYGSWKRLDTQDFNFTHGYVKMSGKKLTLTMGKEKITFKQD